MSEPYDLEMLQAYVEGDMTPEQRDAYEREVLAEDAGLRDLVRDLLADRDALRRLPDEPPERELMPEATERAERAMLLGDPEDVPSLRIAGHSADRRHVWTRRLVYSGVAAAVLLAAGVTFYSLQQMGVDNLDQWEDQPLASSEGGTTRTGGDLKSDAAASDVASEAATDAASEADRVGERDPDPAETLALGDDGAGEFSGALSRRARSAPAAPGVADEVELSAEREADPETAAESMADAARGQGGGVGESRDRQVYEEADPAPAAAARTSDADTLADATPDAADAIRRDGATARSSEEQPPAMAMTDTADRVRSPADAERFRAEAAAGVEMRFRSPNPQQAQQQMLVAARNLGLPVLEPDEPALTDAGAKLEDTREPQQPTRERSDAEVVEHFDQRVSTLQMVVLAPPEQVANELRQFEGTLIGESPSLAKDAPAPHNARGLGQNTRPAASTPVEPPALEEQPAPDADPPYVDTLYADASEDAPADARETAQRDDTTFDYAAILLNSLPIDPAQPIDTQHMQQQRITIFFEPAEAVETAEGNEAADIDAAEGETDRE